MRSMLIVICLCSFDQALACDILLENKSKNEYVVRFFDVNNNNPLTHHEVVIPKLQTSEVDIFSQCGVQIYMEYKINNLPFNKNYNATIFPHSKNHGIFVYQIP